MILVVGCVSLDVALNMFSWLIMQKKEVKELKMSMHLFLVASYLCVLISLVDVKAIDLLCERWIHCCYMKEVEIMIEGQAGIDILV